MLAKVSTDYSNLKTKPGYFREFSLLTLKFEMVPRVPSTIIVEKYSLTLTSLKVCLVIPSPTSWLPEGIGILSSLPS